MNKKRKIYFAFTLTLLLAFSISCSKSATPIINTPVITKGLLVTVTTSSAGGNYAPNHVVAIWVEDNSGKFVKTLTAYAKARAYDLTNWESASAGSTVDATTGATQSAYGVIYGVWNGTDVNGILVSDGTYKVCMELTDKGSTGNFSTFTFTKGTSAATLTPANVPSFSSINIKWLPL